jgi:GH24 family phage-related lysozyme (muramidase)/plastocyanin
MPNPSTTTEAPANNKEKKTAYLICEGALCKCDAGEKPVKIKVDSHKKAYINDNKLIATVKDVTFELPTAPFVTCKNIPSQNKTCQPKFEQWTKPYKDIEVDGNAVITDKSELKCLQYGGTITILKHGQTQDVNAEQANNMDRTIAAQVNALADLAPIAEEDKKVSVGSISGELVEDPKYKPVSTQEKVIVKSAKESKTDVDPSDIHVRPGQEIKFTANIIGGGVEALVCWKLKGSGEPKHFLQHGPMYQTSFSEVGKYTIEGYGTNGDHNLDVDTRIVEKTVKKKTALVKEGRTESIDCMLDILVQENKLIDIRHLESDNIIDVKDNKIEEKAQIRIGVPATFEPVFVMPPIQKEIDELILVIKDAAGTELKRTKGEPKILFEAKNSADHYTIEAYFDGSEGAPIVYPIATSLNTVNVIATSDKGIVNDNVRVGTTLTFKAIESKFMDNTVAPEIIETENTQIKWYENSEIAAGTGRSYSKTYLKEDKYTIICRVTEGQPGWFAKDKKNKDDRTFLVTQNYPTAIEKKSIGISKIGKQISFELKSIFNIDLTDKNTILWNLTGPENITLGRSNKFIFTPKQKGKYSLTVSMNGHSTKDPFEFECTACEIVKGWWTDGDGNMLTGKDDTSDPSNTIGVAGWGQEVCVAFKHIGLGGEVVTIEVWDKDFNGTTSVYTTELTCTEGYNAVKCPLTLDSDLKKNVAKKGASSNGLLYFTVTVNNGLKVANNGMVLPLGEINYLKVDDTLRAKAYFADNNDTKRYSTASTDMPVYVQVKSTNLINEDLELVVHKTICWGISKPYNEKVTFRVDKYGMASVKLDMCIFNEEFSNPNDSIHIFVKVHRKSNSKELYSSDGKYPLTLNKKLNTSPTSTNTTKAFVMVDMSNGSIGSCGGKYCIKTGDVSELVREINIRLAGFGGLVPTDQFTAETRKEVIQFQRDYMKIEPTGQVCGNTLKAIDEFTEKFKFKFDLIKCKCKKCIGFGNGKYSEQYQDLSILERYRKFEYPGLHRSLLWTLKALMFYLNVKEKDLGYSFRDISSGYRCHEDNLIHGRSSTNHMGKALDILFSKNGSPTSNVVDMNSIRKNIFEKYMAATYWTKKNTIGLESAGDGAKSWIHFDIREFDNKYLDKTLFVTSESSMIGQNISLVANKITQNCGGAGCHTCNTSNNLAEAKRVNPKTITTSQNAINFIKEWEEFKGKVYNDSQGYCSIGYGHLIEKKECKDISIPEKFKNGITESQALVLFKIKINKVENAVQRDIKVDLYQYEFDALVSLLYNTGENFLFLGKAPKLLRNINNSKYEDASIEFLDITNSKTVGLVARRNAEKNIFSNNIYDSKH